MLRVDRCSRACMVRLVFLHGAALEARKEAPARLAGAAAAAVTAAEACTAALAGARLQLHKSCSMMI
jgi:hypothetical protein